MKIILFAFFTIVIQFYSFSKNHDFSIKKYYHEVEENAPFFSCKDSKMNFSDSSYSNDRILKNTKGTIVIIDSTLENSIVMILWENGFVSSGKINRKNNHPVGVWRTFDQKNRLRSYLLFDLTGEMDAILDKKEYNKRGVVTYKSSNIVF